MLYDNFTMQTKRRLLIKIAQMLKEGTLVSQVASIPIEECPRDAFSFRCCVHKDRYIMKHKIASILGFEIESEEIDLIHLSEFATRALARQGINKKPYSVIHEACSACTKSQYAVTNMCRGCAARPCIMNCPKGAISSLDGKAHIDPDKCAQCGMCLKACPYHAIVFTPVPCADICPVHAISQKEDGTRFIDLEKCIHCGRCMQVCPFGAIMERSHIVDIALALNDPGLKVVAIPAPSICGQFKATTGQILSAIRQIGFDEVLEVALGAEETARHEAVELKEKMEEGQAFMTSSCCPAYTEWVHKHAPELEPYVSETRSPMIYAARIAREKFPDAVVVFIGPCLAKRFEAEQSGEVDYVMSFEELGAFMVAGGVDPQRCEAENLDETITSYGRGFAQAGGVRAAVDNGVQNAYDTASFDGLDRKTQAQLRAMVKAPTARFVEVMSCEGGCINGPCSLEPLSSARRQLKKALK